MLAALPQQIARLYSDAVSLAHVADRWAHVESPVHWTCSDQPRDLQLRVLADGGGAVCAAGLCARHDWQFSRLRPRLSRRAMVLSGVSHDLGTPATRLRLRARLGRAIDRMTSIINEVQTFTRTEMGT